jgi:integrase
MGRVVVETPAGLKRKTVYGKTYRDCEKKLNKIRGEAAGGLVLDAGGLKVGEWLDRWLVDVLKPLVEAGKMAHTTYVRYAGIVNNHLKPAIGHKKLRDLTRAEVRRLYGEKGKTLAPRSVDYVHVTLQKALSQAVRDDLISRNVATGERPRSSRQQDPEKARALSPAQVRALLDAASGERNEALYVVALHAGLRQGELLGLRWDDVDLEEGRLSVRRSLKVTDHGPGIGPPKNKASRRAVPLNKTAVAALRAHKARQNEEILAAPVWRDSGLVFPNRVGGPMDHNNLYYREYKPLLKRAGLEGKGFTFHVLRHTFATALFGRGQHPKKVQALLGHSSITQTMDTYSHLMEDIGGDAVGGLDEAFG